MNSYLGNLLSVSEKHFVSGITETDENWSRVKAGRAENKYKDCSNVLF